MVPVDLERKNRDMSSTTPACLQDSAAKGAPADRMSWLMSWLGQCARCRRPICTVFFAYRFIYFFTGTAL